MKIIIIGAGLLGSASACFLSSAGHEVIVLERQPVAGKETSYANAGMIHPSQAGPWNQPGILGSLLRWIGREDSPLLLRPGAVFSLLGWGPRFILNSSPRHFREHLRHNTVLADYSLRVMKEFARDHTIGYDATDCGTLKFYETEQDFEHDSWLNDLYREAGVEFKIYRRDEVVQLEPALSDFSARIVAAIHYPDDESGDAHRYCQALADMAGHSGAVFHYGIEVLGFESSGDYISAVSTTRGRYEADAYLLAAGSYSPVIAGSTGLKLPVRPVKGYSVTFDINGWDQGPRMPVVDESAHMAVTPLGQRLRVAGTAEFSGYNTDLRPGRIENMTHFIRKIYPGFLPFMNMDEATPWAGLRPYTCDGMPLLGCTPIPNLYLNTGHGHLGWSMAMGSGKLVTDLLSGNETDIDISPYELARFL